LSQLAADQLVAQITNMTSNLPLIRLSAINPFLLELRRRGVDVKPLLADLNLPSEIPASDDLFVASTTIYELVEKSAELADDKFFGFAIGSQLELATWDPIATATERASSVGELLTMFSVNAAEHSTATRFYLSTDGERSTFGFNRVQRPPFRPGQNDAFYMGFMSQLLRHATHEHWDATQVMFRVADPACIPANGDAYRVAEGDRSGVQITFPSRWLFERFDKSRFQTSAGEATSSDIPQSLVESVRGALRPHLHKSDLNADKAAKICGHDRRKLARRLREEGTTLSKEIAHLRARKAQQDLEQSNQRIAEIGESVGFMDPTVFSRAFKNWTGQSPQEYRRTHRAPE
jgi:AraC-like DNA-binding protein